MNTHHIIYSLHKALITSIKNYGRFAEIHVHQDHQNTKLDPKTYNASSLDTPNSRKNVRVINHVLESSFFILSCTKVAFKGILGMKKILNFKILTS